MGAWSKNTGRQSGLVGLGFFSPPKKEAAHLKVRIETETTRNDDCSEILLKGSSASPPNFRLCYNCMHLALKVKARYRCIYGK